MTTIRLFENGDEKSIAKIEKECFSSPWSEKMILDEIPFGVFLVSITDGEISGYVSARFIENEGYINNIAVQKNFRRQKIALMLLSELDLYAVKNNLSFLTLEVRKSNIPAVSLYEKCGYSLVGERKNFYQKPTENALLLTKFFGEKQ